MKISANEDFAAKRQLIDGIDKKILALLKERFLIAREIGEIKKKNRLAVFDKARESEIILKRTKESGMNEDFVEKLFEVIFEESRRLQK